MVQDLPSEEPPAKTIPASFYVTIQGWENEDEAEARQFGAGIAWDYSAALAKLAEEEPGSDTTPTANEYGQGSAMAVRVVKGEEIRSVVVIWTGLVRKLLDFEDQDHGFALHIVLHELIHVDDLAFLCKTFPGGWKQMKPSDGRKGTLLRIVDPCQSEYSAQLRSAHLAPEHGFALIDMLAQAMEDADEQIIAARQAYRFHGDMDVFWPIVSERLRFLFQALGYSLGHSCWAEEVSAERPELAQRYAKRIKELEAHSTLGWLLAPCREAAKTFTTMSKWQGMEVYDPLIETLEKLLNQYGMFTSAHGDGIYVDMPYSDWSDL